MPIRYESAAPIGGAISRGSYGGGGGGGGGLTAYQDPRVQLQADQNQLEYLRLVQQRAMAGATGRDAYAADTALELQNNRFQLQAWLNEQEMTQAEQLKLRQDRNAVAAIEAQVGKNLTREEADDLILQKVTNINVSQQRLNRQQAESQAKAMEANTKLHLAQTKTLEMGRDLATKSFQDRTAIKVPTQVVMQINRELDKIQGLVDPTDPAAQQKRLEDVKRLAVQRGLHQEFYQQNTGEWLPLGGSPAIGDKGDERGGTTPGQTASSRSTSKGSGEFDKPFDPVKAKHEAEAELTGKIAKDSDGYDKKVGELIEQKRRAYEQGRATSTPEGKAASRAAAIKIETQKQDALWGEVQKRSDMSDDRKMAVGFLINAVNSFTREYGPYESMEPQQRKHVDKLFAQITQANQPDRPAVNPPPEAAAAGPGSPAFDPGLKTVGDVLSVVPESAVAGAKTLGTNAVQGFRQASPQAAELVDRIVERLPEAPTKEDVKRLLTTRFADLFR